MLRSFMIGGSAVVRAVASMELAIQLITRLIKINVRFRSEIVVRVICVFSILKLHQDIICSIQFVISSYR